jgi:GT2 family glycosyltransferase
MPEITVVIPTLRGRDRLPRCIEALRAQTFRDFEVIVVDNASSDGTGEWLAAQADVRVIRNERNVGFAAACNQGIRASRAPFAALLNDDAYAEPGWLAALRDAMADGVGAVASLMVYASRPEIVQCAGICLDRAAIAWERLAGRPVAEAGGPCDVFGASGGACLYRRAMLDEIGLLDEAFFAYQEDVDLAWRARRAGWRCRYAPGARVRHDVSATSGAGSPFKNRLQGRNKMWMAWKNAPLRDWPVIACYDAAAVAYAGVMRGEWAHLRGRWEALRRARSMLRARRGGRPLVSGPDALAAPWRVRERFTAP